MKMPVLPCYALDEYNAFLDSFKNIPHKAEYMYNPFGNERVTCFVLGVYDVDRTYYWYAGERSWSK